MIKSEFPVLFMTDVGVQSSYQTLVSGIPRASAASLIWPKISFADLAIQQLTCNPTWTCQAVRSAALWTQVARLPMRSLLNKLQFISTSDPYNIVTLPPLTIVTPVDSTSPLSVVSYDSNAFTFYLPSNLANSPNAASLVPQLVTFRILGIDTVYAAWITWNIPPVLLAPTLTFTWVEDQVGTTSVVNNIVSSLDANYNLLNIIFLSFTGGNNGRGMADFNVKSIVPPSTTGGYIKTYKGNDNGVPLILGVPYQTLGLTMLANQYTYGSYQFTYQLSDGCSLSPVGVANIQITPYNYKPTCNSFTIIVPPDKSTNISFVNNIFDPETPYTSMKIAFTSSTSNGGKIKQFVSNTESDVSTNTAIATNVWLYYVPNTRTSGTYTVSYIVGDTDGSVSTSCVITFNILASSSPPVISATPLTITAGPGNTVTSNVQIIYYGGATLPLFTIKPISISYTNIDTLRVQSTVDNRVYSTFENLLTSGAFTLQNLALTNGVSRFDIIFKPKNSSLLDLKHTMNLWASDSNSQKSTILKLTCAVPPNQPPLFYGIIGSTSFLENSAGRVISIVGTDPDIQQNYQLRFQITKIPTHGTISDKNNRVLSPGDVLDLSLSSHVAPQDSTYPITYRPFPYDYGVDFFQGVFLDPYSEDSDIVTVSLTIQQVMLPPLSNNITLRLYTNTDISFAISGRALNGFPLTLRLVDLSGLSNTLKRSNFPSVVLSNNYLITDGDWRLTYSSGSVPVTERFTFYLNDTLGYSTQVFYATFIVSVVPGNRPPVAVNGTFTTRKDIPLTIDVTSLFYDLDASNSSVIFIVKSPSINGALRDATSNSAIYPFSIISRSPSSTILISYTPNSLYYGIDSFTFFVSDAYGSISNDATISINVTYYNYPPEISVSPNSVITPRGNSSVFNVRVNDVDSDSISVYLSNNQIPLTWSNMIINPSAAAVTSNSNQLLYTFSNTDRTAKTLTLTWNPNTIIPDGTVGSFTVYATDAQTTPSLSTPQLVLTVFPNNRPFYKSLIGNVTWMENENIKAFSIIGSDLDSYHLDNLRIRIISLPSLGTLVNKFNTSLSANTILPRNLATNPAGSDTSYLFYYKPYQNAYGSDSFQIQFLDSFNATSDIAIIPLTVVFVP